jgi:hypothetical protein
LTRTYTLDELFRLEDIQLKREHGRTPDPDVWRWSPSDIYDWAQMLDIAINYYRTIDSNIHEPLSIWEAGSGIGTKLKWAEQHGLAAYGFELFDEYIEAATKLGVHCEKRDLSDFDNQPSWVVPDIVFTARPFKNDIKERQWEQLVQEQMRPGAVLMSTFTARKPYGWPCLFRAGFRGVWIKPCDYGRSTREPAKAMAVTRPL